MSLLRSVLFSTPLIALCTIVMGTLSLIASFFDHTGKSQHALARGDHHHIGVRARLIVIGAGDHDVITLHRAGFQQIQRFALREEPYART